MYSVFIDKRPIRFAFLINPQDEKWPAQLDAISEYTLDKWRGRFNLVVPTNGEVIDKEWWEFLQKIDPDYVISTTAISDELLARINAEISPIDVEVPRPNAQPDLKPKIWTFNDTLRVVPDSKTLLKISPIPFPLPPSPVLANLQPGWTRDTEVKSFVIRNFGSYPNIVYWNNVLNDIPHVNFHVDTKADLLKALTELSRPEAKVVYPIQVSSLDGPTFYVDSQHEHSYEVFGLVVGDSYEEQVFSWNKAFFGSTVNQSHRLNHLWIPCSFARDSDFMATLGDWLRRRTENVHLFSFSIPEDELSTISDSLDPPPPGGRFVFKGNLYRSVTFYSTMQFPKFMPGQSFSFWQGYSPPLESPKHASHFRAYGSKEELELTNPNLGELGSQTGYWMADVFIESNDDRFRAEGYSRIGSTFWWRLPRKNYLATWIFKQKSRISSTGIPAIQLPAKDPRLSFALPDDINLMRMCVLGDWHGRMAGRIKKTHPSIDEIELSNNGRYLNGFISIFGGLASAHGILSERYWRTVLDQMAGKDLVKDQTRKDKVRGKLRKRIKLGLTPSEIVQNFENLADYVIQLSRELSSEGQSRTFIDLEQKARAEHDEFKQQHKVDWEFSERSLKHELSKMLRTGLLQMGFDQRCPRCGSVNYFVINDARQDVTCDGCRFGYSMPAEATISYRLSSLARDGISSHGLVPVVLVLGQLFRDAHSSFFFSPSLDLFELLSEDPRKHERITDLDIVCIKDGKFVIGEIKNSQERFELDQCIRLAEVAKAVGADVLLFSSLESHQTKQTEEMLNRVREELKHSNVDVGWYQLGQEVFEASRMDY